MKRALLTGITGQDGSYLTEFLLEEGYELWKLCQNWEEIIEEVLKQKR